MLYRRVVIIGKYLASGKIIVNMKKLAKTILAFLNFFALLIKHIIIETSQYFRLFYLQWKYGNAPEVLLAKLRIIAHALDKGLCAANYEGGRGKSKYENCKELISKLEHTYLEDDPTLLWAKEKVKEYEKISQNPSCRNLGNPAYVPNEQETSKYLEFICGRRSSRTFKADKIDENVLAKLVDVGRWSPNSCCRQSVYFYVTQDDRLIEKCMEITPGATCFDNVPCFICVCGDTRFYSLIDKELLYIDASLAAENLLLAAHAYGIEGAPLNWRRHMLKEEKQLKRILDIAPYHAIVFNIAMGYPKFLPPVPARKNLNSVWRLVGD